jgi:hypothetical protein
MPPVPPVPPSGLRSGAPDYFTGAPLFVDSGMTLYHGFANGG